MLQLRSCCCGCSLQTGSVLIGIWYTISSLVMLGLFIWAAVILDEGSRYLMIGLACFTALQAGMSIMLVIGAAKKKSCLIKTWVFWQAAHICLVVLMICIGMSMAPSPGNVEGILIRLGLSIYYLLVVNSYHIELVAAGANESEQVVRVNYIPAKMDDV